MGPQGPGWFGLQGNFVNLVDLKDLDKDYFYLGDLVLLKMTLFQSLATREKTSFKAGVSEEILNSLSHSLSAEL